MGQHLIATEKVWRVW